MKAKLQQVQAELTVASREEVAQNGARRETVSQLYGRARRALCALRLNRKGQDMIEYALLAAAIAVLVAGFLPQDIMPAVSNIFSKITSALAKTPT